MSDNIAVPEEDDEKALIHSFGVGHGDCTLLEFVQKGVVTFRMLVDGGTALPADLCGHLDAHPHANLQSRHIDVVVLTHVDADHQGGLAHLLENDVSIGQYWGPCLAAFRRLLGIFRTAGIPAALKRAEALEVQFRAKGIPVIYPLEGQVFRACDNKVVVSMISPAPRLMQRLLTASGEALAELLVSSTLPLEWLFTPGSEAQHETGLPIDLAGAVNQRHRALLRPVPANLDGDEVLRRAQAAMGDAFNPDFFGNGVLNDTSLVFTVDFHLGRKHRRRVLLTGDQVNWSYIAFQYPHGLAPDVLKAPHHGGRVYLSDKCEDAVDQFYLWMRPRTVAVSASGMHDLPNMTFHNAIRRIGATLLCPNTRGFEPLSAGASAAANSVSCHAGYACSQGRRAAQRAKTSITLSIAGAGADNAACLSGSGHSGMEPIVVLQQRVIEPDQSFLRWTSQEVYKYAKWVAGVLDGSSKQVAATLHQSKEAYADALQLTPVSWRELKAQAMLAGHHHLVANPQAVLSYGQQQGMFWATGIGGDDVKLYKLPSPADKLAVRKWLSSYDYIVLRLAKDAEGAARAGRRFDALQCVDWTCLHTLLGAQQGIPTAVAQETLMPEIWQMLSDDCHAAIYDSAANSYASAYPYGWLVLAKNLRQDRFQDICGRMFGGAPNFRPSQVLFEFMLSDNTKVLLPSLLDSELPVQVSASWFNESIRSEGLVQRVLWHPSDPASAGKS